MKRVKITIMILCMLMLSIGTLVLANDEVVGRESCTVITCAGSQMNEAKERLEEKAKSVLDSLASQHGYSWPKYEGCSLDDLISSMPETDLNAITAPQPKIELTKKSEKRKYINEICIQLEAPKADRILYRPGLVGEKTQWVRILL